MQNKLKFLVGSKGLLVIGILSIIAVLLLPNLLTIGQVTADNEALYFDEFDIPTNGNQERTDYEEAQLVNYDVYIKFYADNFPTGGNSRVVISLSYIYFDPPATHDPGRESSSVTIYSQGSDRYYGAAMTDLLASVDAGSGRYIESFQLGIDFYRDYGSEHFQTDGWTLVKLTQYPDK